MTKDTYLCRLILGVLLALFACTMLINIAHNPLDSDQTQIDEQAHLSYALTLIDQQRWWPDFEHFPMYDCTTAQPLKIAVNYLNHPPTFYWLAKIAHSVLPGLTPLSYRYGAMAISLLGIFLYGAIGLRLAMPLLPTLLYALTPFLIYAYKQIGFYNNDCVAMLGGLLVTYASLLWFHERSIKKAFLLLLLGLGLASIKLTALLLVTLYAVSCLLLKRPMLRSIPWQAYAITILTGILILLPYVHLMLQTGSPAPETIGQQFLMTNHQAGENWSRVLITGWVQEPRMDFLHWFVSFLRDFAVQVSQYDTTFIPLLLLIVGMLRAACQKPQHPLQHMLQACAIATIITLTIHTCFAWGRYLHYGWRLDSGLRYYYPLLALYGAACGYALSGVSRAKRETI